jgi:hypothetical protein
MFNLPDTINMTLSININTSEYSIKIKEMKSICFKTYYYIFIKDKIKKIVYKDKIYDLSKINNFIDFLESMKMKDSISYIFAEHIFQILASNGHRLTNAITNISDNDENNNAKNILNKVKKTEIIEENDKSLLINK